MIEPYREPSRPITIEEKSNRPQDIGAVVAQWAENFAGGLGAGLVWFGVSFAIHGGLHWVAMATYDWFAWDIPPWPDVARVGIASLLVGTIMFGILMWARSSLDEAIDAGEFAELRADYNALEQAKAESDAQWADKYNILVRKHNRLEADHNLLLARKGPLVDGRIENYVVPEPENFVPAEKPQAYTDAITLLERAYHGQGWSRDDMMDEDTMGEARWTKTQWLAARAWLVNAGVLTYTGKKGNVPKWVYPDDMHTALLQIEERQLRSHQAMDGVMSSGS
jgi:hypothetical protein